jgi:hypothetical protein
MGGTLTKSLPVTGRLLVRQCLSRCRLERGWSWVGGLPSTLLGPEATGRLSLVESGRVFLEDTGHRIVGIPASVLVVVSADCLVGSSVA